MDALQLKKKKNPTSRFRGVYAFHSRAAQYKWQCLMTIDETRREHLGTFDTEIGAARAFDARARAIGRSSECNFEEPHACLPQAELHPSVGRPLAQFADASRRSVSSSSSTPNEVLWPHFNASMGVFQRINKGMPLGLYLQNHLVLQPEGVMVIYSLQSRGSLTYSII